MSQSVRQPHHDSDGMLETDANVWTHRERDAAAAAAIDAGSRAGMARCGPLQHRAARRYAAFAAARHPRWNGALRRGGVLRRRGIPRERASAAGADRKSTRL